ncbi:MAG: rRNA adenine N-6-methyltransferase family protein [Clostridium sp.]|uniref:class I SAM-dependent methyltransferase n=1 Tax=Clostridium sp. TaxID=1506 RepID=UPI0032176B94
MFLFEYIKNPKMVGAVAPSGKSLAEKMINSIDFRNAKSIVEYGPGTGVFTEKILARVQNDTIVLLVEVNTEFYNILKNRYGHKKNVIIVNDSAENIDKILKENDIEKVDYIVSGLPFASLPRKVSCNILKKTSMLVSKNTEFITFQYSLFTLKFLGEYFKNINYRRVVKNIPPAYVLKCKGGKYE